MRDACQWGRARDSFNIIRCLNLTDQRCRVASWIEIRNPWRPLSIDWSWCWLIEDCVRGTWHRQGDRSGSFRAGLGRVVVGCSGTDWPGCLIDGSGRVEVYGVLADPRRLPVPGGADRCPEDWPSPVGTRNGRTRSGADWYGSGRGRGSGSRWGPSGLSSVETSDRPWCFRHPDIDSETMDTTPDWPTRTRRSRWPLEWTVRLTEGWTSRTSCWRTTELLLRDISAAAAADKEKIHWKTISLCRLKALRKIVFYSACVVL